jgi:hypothetical protein
MHGDFSRGHRSDGKRGQVYLRALAQERRLLLDSDLNAATDALHERLRGLASHLGCPKGSPDLGYLVTPGRLLALFRELEGVVVASANLTFHRDYLHKYLDRYPSLHLAADQGVQGTITIHLREPADGQVVVWCRRDAAAAVTFDGAALVVAQDADLQPVTTNVNNAQDVVITLDAGGEIWVGLIETRQTATLGPRFGYAGGHFYLDGLPLHNPADVTWVTPAVPTGNFQFNNQNLAADDRLLVYLEAWERHITYVEDLGILEHALGGDTDTMTRGRAIGQVKLAFVPANFDLDAFARALASPGVATGTLDITTPPAPPNPDPCALPVQGGYTGADNRLYRFEVHTGGALGTAVIKWSRDNGSELFAVTNAATNAELAFASNTPLQGGDLVEILTSNSIELGDQTPALLDGAATTFTPSARAVGVLARLVGPNPNGAFTLTGPNGLGVVVLPAHYGPFPVNTLKVRRWHGLITTTAAPVPNDVEVENGVRIALDGTFAPGDYWQYEARTATENANGPFQTAPHGPERDFAPLALMQFQGQNQPLLLERWLDDRFAPLCDLTADDIAFDGGHIGSDSDTVQEVIEELWERIGGGCCEFTLQPAQGDTAVAIRNILQDTQGEVTICFEPGIYAFASTLVIDDRTVVLKGCPRAVFTTSGPVDPILNVIGTGQLVLDHIIVIARQTDGTRVLIDITPQARGILARDTGLFAVPDPAGAAPPTIAIRVGDIEPPTFDPSFANVPAPPPLAELSGPAVHLERVTGAASWLVSARRLRNSVVAESVVECSLGCMFAEGAAQVHVRESFLVAGVSLDALQAWTPDSLLTNRGGVLAPLVDATIGFPADASVAVWIVSAGGAMISSTYFIAGVGIAMSAALSVDLHHNGLIASATGVYLIDAERCSSRGDAVFSLAGQVGIAAGSADRWSVRGCMVEGFNLGIGLAAGRADARTCRQVLIENNHIDRVSTGIQVGPDGNQPYPGELSHVAVTGNTIRSAHAGIVINAQAIAAQNPLALRQAGVEVVHNLVTARLCIGAFGRGVEISDNRLRLVPEGQTFSGIVGVSTVGLVCDSNLIDVSAAQALAPSLAIGPSSNFITTIGGANTAPAAIILAGGGEARVSGNTTRADAAVPIRSLSVTEHARLSVKGNDLASGPVTCDDTDDIVFLDNTVLGSVRISSAVNGQVADNRVRLNEPLKLDGDLEILLATGRWKVADNRADGAIRIVPSSTGGGFFPGVLQPGNFTLNTWRGVDAISRLAGDERFTTLISPPPDLAAPAPVPAPTPVPPTDALSRASYAMHNVSWREDYTRSMESYIDVGINANLAELIGGRDIIIVLSRRESEYHVQCTSNWSRDLQIGVLNPDFATSVASVIQVVSNRADQELAVRRYARLVIALNIAAQYRFAGNAQSQAIDVLNLDI